MATVWGLLPPRRRDRSPTSRKAARDATSGEAVGETAPAFDASPAADRRRGKNLVAAYILLGVVALAPLPFGSHDPLSEVFWCLVLAIAATNASPHDLKPMHLLLLGVVGLIVCAFGLVLYQQVWTDRGGDAGASVWQAAARLVGSDRPPVTAIVRYEPLFSLGPTLASVMALALGIVTGAERGSARRLLRVFAWSGAVYALYGIFAALVTPNEILWREREGYDGVVLGTFINRNTAATYFGSCAIIWSLMLSEAIRKIVPKMTWKWFARKILAEVRIELIVQFVAFFVSLMALFMTNSRAGVVFSLLAIATGVLVTFWQDLPRFRIRLVTIGIGLVIVLVLLQLLGGTVNQRFETSGLSDEGRFDVYRATLRMIVDHVWTGTGLGTFVWAFPGYRQIPPSMWGIWDMAHSTPLQMAAEVGLPLTLSIAAAFLAALLLLARGISVRRRDKIIPLSAFLIVALGLAHSCIDFSLQIPGYAIPFMALLGTGLAQSFRSEMRPPRDRRTAISSMDASHAAEVRE